MNDFRKLSHEDVVNASKLLEVDVASIYTVLEVESKGNGFITLPDSGDVVPIILFERHKMYKFLKQKGIDTLKLPSDIVNEKAGGYKSSVEEWKRLDRAIRIDRESALKSCSWGLFQVMGFNFEVMNYESVQAFVNEMYRSEFYQLEAFCRFVKFANPPALTALKAKNWAKFAEFYNGKNYAINKYDEKLADAYKLCKAKYP